MEPQSSQSDNYNLNAMGSTIPVASQKAKKMMECVRNLQHLGIEDAAPELPSVCVIGDQSVGKRYVTLVKYRSSWADR